jgi:hypothetical protein
LHIIPETATLPTKADFTGQKLFVHRKTIACGKFSSAAPDSHANCSGYRKLVMDDGAIALTIVIAMVMM